MITTTITCLAERKKKRCLLLALPQLPTLSLVLLRAVGGVANGFSVSSSSSTTSTTTSKVATATSTTTTTTSSKMSPLGTYNKIVKNVQVPGLKNGMDYVRLGNSDLVVSKICMGTMTFGEQNTIEDGIEQLQYAFDTYGINFVDTAEMYPVPTKADTQGKTDQAVREFLKTRKKRSDVILATKVAGRAPHITWLPREKPNTTPVVSREQILYSVQESLKRLDTDYIDLLQIHWPDRYAGGLFGQVDFKPSLYEDRHYGDDNQPDKLPVDFEEQLSALQELVREGKVRYVGVSNETPYGVCYMSLLAKTFPDLYPKIISIQNSYSLVVRKDFEAGLAECCYHNNVGLLAYSPLAGGSLSGKYRASKQDIPKGSRLTLFPGFMDRYLDSLNEDAVNAYCSIAEKYNMTPTQLSLSWCYHNELVTSSIIGATTMKQLEENCQSYDIKLSEDIMKEIDDVYKKYTDPTKAR